MPAETSAQSLLRTGDTCWRIEQATKFSFVVDGADYFVALREALLQARHSIMLIGWDFDPRISLGEKRDEGPEKLGDFIIWLADQNPQLEIRLLRWDTGAFKSMLRGNTLLTILRWKLHKRITLRLDAKHPLASSHHQKIVVIDDTMAFCGGIDMTMKRWDTREHLDNDPRRVNPAGRMLEPWHDATSAIAGDAATALGDLARARWQAACGEVLAPPPNLNAQEEDRYWPASLTPNFTQMRLGIARTIPKMEDVAPVHEIEQAWIAMIERAERYIYAENQYFASRHVAHAIAKRLTEDDPPEIVIICPHSAEGWLEPLAMDTARAQLVEALQKLDHKGRFRLYHPQTAAEAEIYVHAKVMVVDDMILRVGSSNLNNRSMRLDTECDVILSADLPENDHLRDEIVHLRNDLMAEHLGVSYDRVTASLAETGSLIATIEALRGKGRSLVPYKLPEVSDFAAWLAENEILDPNGPDDIFEATSKRGLFKRWDKLKSRIRQRRNLPKR